MSAPKVIAKILADVDATAEMSDGFTLAEKLAPIAARVLGEAVTIPDGDGGSVTYDPEGGWSHEL